MKTLIFLLFPFITFGQRVYSIKTIAPIVNTGTQSYPIIGMTGSVTGNIAASQVTSGKFDTARLPMTLLIMPAKVISNLPTSVITSGKFDTARLPVQIFSLVTEVPTGLTNGSNVVFKLTGTPLSNVQLFLNGLRIIDFKLAGSTITMTKVPQIGDDLLADYFK
jgi:hypothetical protein